MHRTGVTSVVPRGPLPSWPGRAIARGLARLPDRTGGFVLDGLGGLHLFALGNDGYLWVGTAAPDLPTARRRYGSVRSTFVPFAIDVRLRAPVQGADGDRYITTDDRPDVHAFFDHGVDEQKGRFGSAGRGVLTRYPPLRG